MLTRLKILVLAAAIALAVTAPATRNPAHATPQSAPPAKSPKPAAAANGISIPDTTLAINSPTAMSERIVHYEIDAKYDAAKHAVEAT